LQHLFYMLLLKSIVNQWCSLEARAEVIRIFRLRTFSFPFPFLHFLLPIFLSFPSLVLPASKRFPNQLENQSPLHQPAGELTAVSSPAGWCRAPAAKAFLVACIFCTRKTSLVATILVLLSNQYHVYRPMKQKLWR